MNTNQKIILERLKKHHTKSYSNDPMPVIEDMIFKMHIGDLSNSEYDAYENLSSRQQFEVLGAFAEWGLANDV